MALWGGVVVVVAAVASQFLLPLAAERVVRERASRYGKVLGVHVSALPAVELLWEHAQSATLHLGSASMSQQQAAAELWHARGVERLDVTAASLRVGAVRLEDVAMRKRGKSVEVVGTIDEEAVRAALPAGMQLQGLSTAGGRIEVRAAAEVFGARISVTALVLVSEGAVVVEPQGLPLGGLARVTVFSEPHLRVEEFSLVPLAGAGSSAGSGSGGAGEGGSGGGGGGGGGGAGGGSGGASWRASLRATLVGG